MILAIRVLKDGVPVREQLFRDTPIRIGRSETCDLILTDASVSRHHATIERDPSGALIIVDGSGTNGLYAGPKRMASEPLVGRLRARLGLAEIEIEEVSAEATQPISLEDLHRLDQRRTPLTWAKYIGIALLALVTETILMPEFWSPWNSQRVVSVVWQCAYSLVAILVLASLLLGVLKAAGRRVRMADVLKTFATFAWLRPLAVVLALLGYYVFSDGTAAFLRGWLPSFATIAFLAQAAAIRRPPPNRLFRCLWAAAVFLMIIGVDFTRSYAAQRIGQPDIDHTMQAPMPGLGSGPAVTFEQYGAAVEAAGTRSEAEVR